MKNTVKKEKRNVMDTYEKNRKGKNQSATSCSVVGKWITHTEPRENVMEFCRHFECDGAVSARLLICGLGFFDARINGIPVDDTYFKPLVTDYSVRDISKNRNLLIGEKQRVCIYEYDISKLLCDGNNSLNIIVGNGYYNNEDKAEEPYISYGDKKAIFEISLTDLNGERIIASDEETLVRYTNTVSGLFNGDRVDFSKGPSDYVKAVSASIPSGELIKPQMPSDRVSEELLPIASWKKSGTVYDFGINHSGGLRFSVKGRKGQKITVRYAEVLNENKTLNMDTGSWSEFDERGSLLHRIDQEDEYILSGEFDKIEPTFSWHCYRYAEIIGEEGCVIENLCSLYIHSDIEPVGRFDCSEPLFREIREKARRTVFNNLHAGLLTDCPHREKRCYTVQNTA